MNLNQWKKNLVKKIQSQKGFSAHGIDISVSRNVNGEKAPGERGFAFFNVNTRTVRPTKRTIKWRAKGH